MTADQTAVNAVTATLERIRIVPVIVSDNPGSASPLAAALVAGGLPVAEVTFRTTAAVEVLRAMAANPDLLVGAGTVVTVTQIDQAVNAGARFVMSPGLDAQIVRRCQELGVPVFPGVATPTEIQAALACGVSIVKFFPAEPLGGATTVAALAAPFGGVRFIPTGGIGPVQAREYLALKSVLAIGGSWIAPPAMVSAADWPRITARAAEAVALLAEAGTPAVTTSPAVP
jgi:2-dehydro-3-deoxyphosphogluconate aldolase / (4S)-4-hydroxy-2-oxoglutarate aldolase